MARRNIHASRLAPYPLLSECFGKYVSWLVSDQERPLSKYALIQIIEEGDSERLAYIEQRLQESRSLLKLTCGEFARSFGFKNDLLSDDPERVHDVLAEPMFVPDLATSGFSSISKLPSFIQAESEKLRNADFSAELGKTKFVIELKTVRMENRPPPEPGRLLGDATQPYWWGNMFRNNAITKIEDKGQRVLEQLANAKQHYDAGKTILALYTRRVGPSTLMSRQDYVKELTALSERYSQIDHFISKDYFGNVEVFPPIDGRA